MRLGLKLSLLLAVASIGPLLLATALTLPQNQQQLRRQLDDFYRQSAQALAQEANQALEDKIEALALASNALPFATLRPREREQALLLIYRQTKGADIVGLFTSEGQPAAPPVYFSSLSESDRQSHELINEQDTLAYAENVPLQAAVDAGIAVGPVYVGKGPNDEPVPRVVVALRVPGKRDTFVLAVELSLRMFVERFAQFRIGQLGRAYLLDGADRIVASLDPSEVQSRELHALGAPSVLGASADVLVVGWKAVVEQPHSEALAAIRRQLQGAVVAIVISLIAALAVGLTTVRLVTRPINRLRQAATQVAAGTLTTEVPVKGHDEIAELGQAFNVMTRGLRERERLRQTFSRYVSDEIAARVLEETSDSDLQGEQVEVTVLFLDLRGFTSLSETCTPKEVVDLLNTYFDIVVRVVAHYQGVINKFIGDAVMVVFGVPKAIANPEERAVRAAVDIQREMATLNAQRLQHGQQTAHFGIGINTGQAIAGNIGGQQRLEYTVIGDAVNVAQRLQSQAAKDETIVSALTVSRVKADLHFKPRGAITVKGRQQPIDVFEAPTWESEQLS